MREKNVALFFECVTHLVNVFNNWIINSNWKSVLLDFLVLFVFHLFFSLLALGLFNCLCVHFFFAACARAPLRSVLPTLLFVHHFYEHLSRSHALRLVNIVCRSLFIALLFEKNHMTSVCIHSTYKLKLWAHTTLALLHVAVERMCVCVRTLHLHVCMC